MEAINQGIQDFEGGLNEIGHVPIASTVIAPIRGLLAVAEIVGGIGLLMICGFCSDSSKGWGVIYVQKGLENLIRAVIELIPIVNLLTILYDSEEGLSGVWNLVPTYSEGSISRGSAPMVDETEKMYREIFPEDFRSDQPSFFTIGRQQNRRLGHQAAAYMNLQGLRANPDWVRLVEMV